MKSNKLIDDWKFAIHIALLSLLLLSLTVNAMQLALIKKLETARLEISDQLIQAKQDNDYMIQRIEALSIKSEQIAQTEAGQEIVYEPVDVIRCIGEFKLTAYCSCEKCCGKWANGLTATGILAEPGIIAVDPDIIPLGSKVIIDGEEYLAADTGVKGMHIDLFFSSHDEALQFGVQTAEVWVVENG